MFQRLFSSGQVYLFALLILALVGLSVALKFSYADVAVKQGTIDHLTTQKQTLQQDLNNAADQLLVAEQDKHRLRQQIKLVSKLNIEHEQRQHKIQQKLQDQHQLIAQLRTSQNETVNHWANTPVPDDAWRLLYDSTHCTNRNAQQNQSCIGSKRNDWELPAAES